MPIVRLVLSLRLRKVVRLEQPMTRLVLQMSVHLVRLALMTHLVLLVEEVHLMACLARLVCLLDWMIRRMLPAILGHPSVSHLALRLQNQSSAHANSYHYRGHFIPNLGGHG
jgi:hypothetical protein